MKRLSLAALYKTHAPLTFTAISSALLALVFTVLIVVDPRVITGAPAWLKPTKFAVSVAIYSFTLVWLLGFLTRWRRLVNVLAWSVVVIFALELAIIGVQAWRGTTSHFNVSTPLDAALYTVMGSAISALWGTNIVIAVLVLFQRFKDPVLAASLRLGLLLTVIGIGLGYLMVVPSAQQKAAWDAGAPATITGAHTVGRPDGGQGLPVVGWSTEGGDLRIGHFVGIHALQVVPFWGWLVSRRKRLSVRARVALVWVLGGYYLGVMGVITQQALRAQPLLQPDALTAGLFAGLSLLTLFIMWTLVRRPVPGATLEDTYA